MTVLARTTQNGETEAPKYEVISTEAKRSGETPHFVLVVAVPGPSKSTITPVSTGICSNLFALRELQHPSSTSVSFQTVEQTDPPGGTPPPRKGKPIPPLLQVDHLTISFPSTTVVDDLSFSIAPGETLGLVGESGSGKSATSLALLRLLPPSATVTGQITFNARRLDTLPEAEIRALRGSALAMIFQEPMTALNPVMRIGDQIAESLLAHHPKLPRSDVRARVLAAMHEVALPSPETRLRDFPHQFSGGQRQRILIAMALINRPQLLIADEPTTALDVTVQAQILDLLRSLRASMNLAMLFISHDLAVVSQIADRVAVMQHGRLVEQAATATLFRSPQHPYTRRLLASAPTMHTDRAQPLATLR